MNTYSVIITHYQREKNLLNTLNGLRQQTRPPYEVIIVEMGDGLELDDNYPFLLEVIDFNRSWDFIPLAAARNLGAECSRTEQLIFLDVDCIPASTFCEKIFHASATKDALVMGSPRYLLRGDLAKGKKSLIDNSILHPLRPKIKGLSEETCYELFWSLCFAMPKQQFEYVGGFDESYQGYGGEDTDFALEVKRTGIPFYLSDAEVYHQQHPIYIPPLNHLEAIVKNSNIFYSKWKYWPMVDCLSEFAAMDYILWENAQNRPIQIKSRPSKDDVASRLIKNAPYR
ncbi:MAG: glycosyltransferase [Pricia sp.]